MLQVAVLSMRRPPQVNALCWHRAQSKKQYITLANGAHAPLVNQEQAPLARLMHCLLLLISEQQLKAMTYLDCRKAKHTVVAASSIVPVTVQHKNHHWTPHQ